LFDAAKSQHLDAPANVRQGPVRSQRRVERHQRVALTVQRHERVPAADERGDVPRLLFQGAIEVWQRGFGVRAGEFHVPERGLGRMKRRRQRERGGELALRGPEIA